MIRTGETITVEIYALGPDTLETVRALPGVTGADYADARLTVRCQSGGHNLITLLDCLNKQDLSFGRVYSEPPTLNDVFLEITGKELRD